MSVREGGGDEAGRELIVAKKAAHTPCLHRDHYFILSCFIIVHEKMDKAICLTYGWNYIDEGRESER
jgi:hypothetical protein